MDIKISSTILSILKNFAPVFSQPTFDNFVFLSIGAILTNGSRTVTNMLRTLGPLRPKHFTCYHNFFRRSTCPLFKLSKILCSLIFSRCGDSIDLVVDETLSRHKGPKIFGRCFHRDPIRSSKKNVQYTSGHKWVVIGVRFRIPWIKRVWVLPCVMMLWVSEKHASKFKVRHRTYIELTIIMLRLLHRWFPDKHFNIVGDGGFASIELTRFAQKRSWIELVSRLRIDAQLFDEPGQRPKGQRGRKRVKGHRLPSPQQMAENKKLQWQEARLDWYGGLKKDILFINRNAIIYQPGKGTAKISWVLVRDPEGDHRDEAFYTTDLSMNPLEIIRHFIERWSIEVTFEESKRFLQIESSRNRKKESVLRSFPLLLSLFSLITLWYAEHFKEPTQPLTEQDWYSKQEPTFADAMRAIRKEIWDLNLFSMSAKNGDMVKIPSRFMNFISDSLVGFG